MIGELVCACGTALILAPLLAASDSVCCDDEIIAATTQAEHELGLPPHSLFVTNRDDLSSGLIDLQAIARAAGKSNLPVPVVRMRVFELARSGNRVENGNLVEQAVDLDDFPLWRVAYDCTAKAAFHLYGFDNSTEGFNDLIRALHLKVATADVALYIQSSFVELTYLTGREVVRDQLGLMKAALENFSGRGTERAFLASWAKCPGDVKRMIVPPSASASVSAFSVTFFASPDGTVERVSMFVEPDGQVRSLKSSPIYRWPQSGTNHRQSVL